MDDRLEASLWIKERQKEEEKERERKKEGDKREGEGEKECDGSAVIFFHGLRDTCNMPAVISHRY